MTKSIPEWSADSQLLYKRFVDVQPDQVVTYDELSSIIHSDVRKDGRGALYSAKNRALRDNQIVLEAVRNVGLKRLNDISIATNVGPSCLRKIRSTARSGKRKLVSVQDFEALPNAAKLTHNTHLSFLGAIDLMSKHHKIRKLEQQAKQTALPPADALKAFQT